MQQSWSQSRRHRSVLGRSFLFQQLILSHRQSTPLQNSNSTVLSGWPLFSCGIVFIFLQLCTVLICKFVHTCSLYLVSWFRILTEPLLRQLNSQSYDVLRIFSRYFLIRVTVLVTDHVQSFSVVVDVRSCREIGFLSPSPWLRCDSLSATCLAARSL